jgi:Bacteriophage baseplate protein W
MVNPQQLNPAKAFLGIGWAYPTTLAPDGTIAEAVYEEDVCESIWIILGTNPGERVMRPGFGAGLKQFVFEPVNSTTLALIKTRVQEALIDWEPRIDVMSVQVTPQFNGSSLVLIDVNYRVRATNAVGNLVYPFYLQEGTTP